MDKSQVKKIQEKDGDAGIGCCSRESVEEREMNSGEKRGVM